MKDPNRPPRPGRGVLLRALFACVLTVSLSATAVASAVWLEGHELVEAVNRDGRTIIDVPEVDRADAGDPRTFLILGYGRALRRQGRGRQAALGHDAAAARRSGRPAGRGHVDPARPEGEDPRRAGRTRSTSRIELGGPGKTVSTIKRLFKDATGESFPINHVMAVSFGGFRRAVNYIDGVYVDIDRRYYNDNSTAAAGEAYATIDVQPGYQKLKGQDALDYVRYRHGDNDFFRASRQQDFLRQISHQDGVRALLDVGKRKELAHRVRALLRGRRLLHEGVEPDRAGQAGPVHGAGEGADQRGPLPGHRGREPGGRLLPVRQGLRPAARRTTSS